MSIDSLRYNRAARILHWLIALMVIANLLSGFLHDQLAPYFRLMPLHKSTGLTILILSFIRLGWRAAWRRPPYPASVGRTEIAVANAVQATFYGLMIAMPVTGWIIASAGKYPLSWFGLADITKFQVDRNAAIYHTSHGMHEILGWLFLALIVLHVAAGLRHHLLLRDNVLRRMV
ncbi:MAG: cytochrome b [Sphingomonadaceae bacterium]